MGKNTKIALGTTLLVGGAYVYTKTDNKVSTNDKAMETVGNRTICVVAMVAGLVLIFKGIK